MKMPILLCLALMCSNLQAQSARFEVRPEAAAVKGAPSHQRALIEGEAWQSFLAEHAGWHVEFDVRGGGVHRAYGPGFALPGADAEQRALGFLAGEFQRFGWQDVELGSATVLGSTEKPRVMFHQTVNGLPVHGSEVQVLFAGDRVVMWAAQVWAGTDLAGFAVVPASLSDAEMIASARQGMPTDQAALAANLKEQIMRPEGGDFLLAQYVQLKGKIDGRYVQYLCLVDRADGRLVSRQDQVRNAGLPVVTSAAANASLAVSAQIKAAANLYNPYIIPETIGLPHLQISDGSETLYTDAEGNFTSAGNPPAVIEATLTGRFSSVEVDDVTPSFNFSAVQEGDVLDASGLLAITETSAYVAITRMHDHMKGYMPDFTALDFPIPTRVDIGGGNCNAYYTPGQPTMNFYAAGGDCNAFSLVTDVAYHEYGHGINDQYYQSLGASFSNGAVGEGYADFWAMSLSNNPVLGEGCYNTDPTFYIRRYDIDPKVYPQDLVGEVHSDGEIICGAWYDTHLLMGADWQLTMGLFLEVYDGLQANSANGNEGSIFTEVLLDLLSADDDNGDLTDGTPHALEILEGFAIHGITLFSNVNISHAPIGHHEAAVTIEFLANASIQGVYGPYFEQMSLYFKTAPEAAYQQVTMEPTGAGYFSYQMDAQPEGTVIRYYFAIEDIFGAISAFSPFSADLSSNANLPHFALIGLTEIMRNDLDESDEFGVWQEGVAGDIATTGQWETTIPVGSFSDIGDPSSIVAADMDHTPFGDGYCFVTGESSAPDGGIGENDIDGGHTTLMSPVIDLSGMADPVMSYWRWYVNAPATGANPGADWWQVEVSDDAGTSWTYVENTKTQDVKWRQSAFRVQEYVELSDAFRIRFTASDSLHPGQEYDGGSLIEAAVDDIILYDLASTGVDEMDGATGMPSGIMAWPVPAVAFVNLSGWQADTEVRCHDITGRLLSKQMAGPTGALTISCEHLPNGTVLFVGMGRRGHEVSHSVVISNVE